MHARSQEQALGEDDGEVRLLIRLGWGTGDGGTGLGGLDLHPPKPPCSDRAGVSLGPAAQVDW